MEALKKNVKCLKSKPTEKYTDSNKKSNTSKERENSFAEKPTWMFKDPSDMENPRICNDKKLWWCLIKTGEKCNIWEYHLNINSKHTGSAKKIGRGESSQSGGKNIKLERAMGAVVDH